MFLRTATKGFARTAMRPSVRLFADVAKAPVSSAHTVCSAQLSYKSTYNGALVRDWHRVILDIMGARDVASLAGTFEQYSDVLTHQLIGMAYAYIGMLKMDLEPEFWDIVFPYGKAVVMEANRDTADSMVQILLGMSKVLVQDEEMWKTAVDKKLIKDNLLRYVQLPDLPELYYALAYNKKGTPELFERMEKQMMKHLKYYQIATDKKVWKFLKMAFEESGRPMPKELKAIVDEKYHPAASLPQL